MSRSDEAQAQFKPIVGDPEVDARREFRRRHDVVPHHRFNCSLTATAQLICVRFCDIEENLLRMRAIVAVGNREDHLFPNQRKVAAIIIDGFGKDHAIGDADDTRRKLPPGNPGRRYRVIKILRRGFSIRARERSPAISVVPSISRYRAATTFAILSYTRVAHRRSSMRLDRRSQ